MGLVIFFVPMKMGTKWGTLALRRCIGIDGKRVYLKWVVTVYFTYFLNRRDTSIVAYGRFPQCKMLSMK